MKRFVDHSLRNRLRSAVLLPSVVLLLLAGYLLLPAVVWQMFEPRVASASFTVTNTSDTGLGSLRDALLNANLDPNPDSISFNIPPSDPRHFYYRDNGVPGSVSRSMIAITSAADDGTIGDIDPDWAHSWYSIETEGFVGFATGQSGIRTPVTIDGLSQPGSVPNTNPSGSLNSVLKIEVTNSATDLSCSRIFHIAFDQVVVRGLIINGCSPNSENKLIDFDFASHSSIAVGNYLGTDPSGTVGVGSGFGVQITQANGVRVGGTSPADRNLISANARGVYIGSGSSSGANVELCSVIGNLIGTERDGVSPLGNGFVPGNPGIREHGVIIASVAGQARGHRVENNVIAFNAGFGVTLAGGGVGTGQSVFRNPIRNNSIHSNGDIGINIPSLSEVGNAVSPNDPCDDDAGMNGLQNFPVIKSAVISGDRVSIAGTLNSIPGRSYNLEFYASSAADATFFGEGQTVLGTRTVALAEGSCNGRFYISLPLPAGAGNVITATATDPEDNTSEFSAVYLSQPQNDLCAHCPGGLVSWYPAEGNVNDSEGENHGRFIQNPPHYTAGKVGQAFDLGNNFTNIDVIEVPDSPNLDLTNAFTIEMWVAPKEAGRSDGTSFFISKGDFNAVGTQSYGIIFLPDGKINNRIGNSTAIDGVTSASSIPLDQFSHIATTYDGTTMRVYVNGVLDASQNTSIGTLLDTAGPLVIGGAFFLNNRLSMLGAIDEPSLYNRALSDMDIARIFAAGSAGKCHRNAKAAFDFDGDARTDVSVFRPSDGNWYLQQSSAGIYAQNFGLSADRLVPADYDGDRRTDIAVYRPASNGVWYIDESGSNTGLIALFGITEDIPVPADYDGDGKSDIAVFRPSEAIWYILNSSDGTITSRQFGIGIADWPAVGDFDCDGKADISVYRAVDGIWYRINSSDGSFYGEQFGNFNDRIVQADYDGDSHTDLAVYRPAEGIWYVKYSSDESYHAFVFGLANDTPTPGDYDGDGRSDFAVFRPADGYWYIANSSNGTFTSYPWGISGDKPIPAVYGN